MNQRAEIGEMVAGANLDELVARYFMNWIWSEGKRAWCEKSQFGEFPSEPVGRFGYDEEDRIPEKPEDFAPSSDLNHAMLVFKKLPGAPSLLWREDTKKFVVIFSYAGHKKGVIAALSIVKAALRVVLK